MTSDNANRGAALRGALRHLRVGIVCCALLAVASCDQVSCCGDPPAPLDVGTAVEDPSPDPVSLPRLYAQQLPRGAHGLLVVRSFDAVATALAALRPHAMPFLDLQRLEAEVRNTFGVDFARAVSFEESGVDYGHGLALAMLAQQPVMLMRVNDPARFLERLDETLVGQPFNLRAPITREERDGALWHTYSAERNGRAMVVAVVARGYGVLVMRGQMSADLAHVAQSVVRTTPETSLASHPDFELQLARYPGEPGFAFYDLGSAAAFYHDRFGADVPSSLAESFEYAASAMTSIGAGAVMEGRDLTFEAHIAMSPQEAELWTALTVPALGEPAFRTALATEALGGVRLSFAPGRIREVLERFQSPSAERHFAERLRALEEDVALGTIADWERLLGGDALVTIGRVAPLDLARARDLGGYIGALDLVAQLTLADGARPEGTGEGAAEAWLGGFAGEAGRLATGTGHGFRVLRAGEGHDGFGELLFDETDGSAVIWTSARMRARMPGRDAEGAPEPGSALGTLVSQPGATGFFVNVERLAPIAVILNWSRDARRALGIFEQLVVTVRAQERGLALRMNVRLQQPD